MLQGFNHNLRHRDLVFHVQTEDGGERDPRVVTQLFIGGRLLSTERWSYRTLLDSGIPPAELLERVRDRLMAQHKEMLRAVTRGDFDALVTGVEVASEPFAEPLSGAPSAEPLVAAAEPRLVADASEVDPEGAPRGGPDRNGTAPVSAPASALALFEDEARDVHPAGRGPLRRADSDARGARRTLAAASGSGADHPRSAALVDEELRLLVVSESAEPPTSEAGARLACELLRRHLGESELILRAAGARSKPGWKDVEGALRVALRQVHLGLKMRGGAQDGESSTCALVAALLFKDRALVARSGAPCAYLVRGQRAAALTPAGGAAFSEDGAVEGESSRVPHRASPSAGEDADLHWVDLAADDRLVLLTSGLLQGLKSADELAEPFERLPSEHVPLVLVDLALHRGTREPVAVAVAGPVGEAAHPSSKRQWLQLEAWRRVRVFEGMSLLHLSRVLPSLEERAFGPREEIPGGAGLWMVKSGIVSIRGRGARREVTAGALLGEVELVSSGAWGYRAVAQGAVRLVRIPRAAIEALLEREPAAASRLLWVALEELAAKLGER